MWRETLSSLLSGKRIKQVDYADVRVIPSHCEETLLVKNGKILQRTHSENVGYGIRVLAGGAWGFASCSTLDHKEAEKSFDRAIEMARASALIADPPVRLYPVRGPIQGKYRTPCQKDPFTEVTLEEKVKALLKTDQLLRESSAKVTLRESSMTFSKMEKIWMNSEGSYVEQELIESGAGMEVVAVLRDEVQKRSYPNSFRGNIGTAGYEFVESMRLADHALRIGEEAEALLFAAPCPETRTDLILMPDQLCLQIHESIGHAIELDRIFGSELTYAGGSFLSEHIQELGNFRYGSPLVNIVSDSTLREGLGTFGYDDEGIAAQKNDIIREGMLVGLLSSRESSDEYLRLTGKSLLPNSCMRATHSNRVPLIRMTNLYLEPGEGTLAELIHRTNEGILMETNSSWSIDDLRKNFSFGTEIAWEIKKGKRTRMLKNPFYRGMTLDFWNSCNAVCGPSEWRSYGTPNCGKGMPGQSMHVGHGASPARFGQIQVGSQGLK
ncbi:MAG: TldD/PmbA family protein [Nitrospirae bacterium]|nr:TldD/PmbA family protein [Nitrospirota bacterium]